MKLPYIGAICIGKHLLFPYSNIKSISYMIYDLIMILLSLVFLDWLDIHPQNTRLDWNVRKYPKRT